MRPMQAEMTDPSRLDAMLRFDCRVRRWLGRVPLSTIVVLVDAIVDEMETRARPRCRGVAREAPVRTAEPSEQHVPE